MHSWRNCNNRATHLSRCTFYDRASSRVSALLKSVYTRFAPSRIGWRATRPHRVHAGDYARNSELSEARPDRILADQKKKQVVLFFCLSPRLCKMNNSSVTSNVCRRWCNAVRKISLNARSLITPRIFVKCVDDGRQWIMALWIFSAEQ